MANEPASVLHVPTLPELGERLESKLGDEASARFRSVGSAMDLHDAAAYAVHQVDLARQALSGPQRDGDLAGLTAREAQVLRLIADGSTTRDISEQLFISAKTADNHIQHIYTKIGVTNRAAAARWAIDRDLVVRTTSAEPG
jgi:DNA-binding CsgD family transcriptional regulator